MKRILPAGERCGFLVRFPKLMLLVLFIIINNSFTSFSQTLPNGNLIPGIILNNDFWNKKFLFYEEDNFVVKNLSEYKGKTIVLDFWSVTCSPCINSFPKLTNIQNKYSDKLEIILVNPSDDLDKVKNKFQSLDSTYQIKSIVGDQYLMNLFPHIGYPYHVWIDSKGRIIALTLGTFLTEENIKIMIGQHENL